MRFRFKTIDRPTGISPSELMTKIVDEVCKADYKITNQNENIVQFKFRYDFWQISYRYTHHMKLDGGEIIVAPESNTVNYSFYISLNAYLITIFLAIVYGMIKHQNYFGAVIFIFVLAVIRIISAKKIGNQLIHNISRS